MSTARDVHPRGQCPICHIELDSSGNSRRRTPAFVHRPGGRPFIVCHVCSLTDDLDLSRLDRLDGVGHRTPAVPPAVAQWDAMTQAERDAFAAEFKANRARARTPGPAQRGPRREERAAAVLTTLAVLLVVVAFGAFLLGSAEVALILGGTASVLALVAVVALLAWVWPWGVTRRG